MFLSCRPFVVITTFSTGLVGVEVTFRELINYQVPNLIIYIVGLGVTCSPRDLKFAGSYPTKVDGFFQDVKILSTNHPGETLS